jgi:hypothetical protein
MNRKSNPMSTHPEPLEIERLIRPDQRFTVADHAKWRDDLAAQQAAQQPADEIDAELEADPMIERIARRRKNSEAARTLAILDELERSTEA